MKNNQISCRRTPKDKSTDTYQTTKTLLKENQRMNTQYTKSKEEYWIDNLPPKLTEQNYPTLSQNSNTDTNQQIQHKSTNKNQDQLPQNITIVEETPISQQLQADKNDIEFLSPPIITKTFTSTTPDTIDTLTRSISESQTKTKKPDDDKSFPSLYKKGKIIKQETMQETVLKMTHKLAKMSYRDTGFLNNAIEEERKQIIGLSINYQIGRYDPSNIFIVNYNMVPTLLENPGMSWKVLEFRGI